MINQGPVTWQGELAFEEAVGMEAEKVSGTDVWVAYSLEALPTSRMPC